MAVLLFRPRLNMILAATWLALFAIAVASALILFRVAHQIGVDTSERVGLANTMIDLDAHAALDFKTQMQEWKDMLLLQYDHVLYAKHLESFGRRSDIVQEDLSHLAGILETANLEPGVVDGLRQEHKLVTDTYLAALREIPVEGKPENVRLLNGRVVDLGEELDAMFEGMADSVQAQTILFAVGETERVVSRHRGELIALLTLLSVFLPGSLLASFFSISRLTGKVGAQREHLLTTLHAIADAVVVIDPNDRISHFNAAAAELTGWGREEAYGRRSAEVLKIVTGDAEKVGESAVEHALREGRGTSLGYQAQLISRDGGYHSIEGSASPIRVDHDRVDGVVLVFRDTTERKKMLHDFELAHTALEKSKVPLFQISPDGRILDVNSSACALLGYSHGELVDKPIWEFDPEYAPHSRHLMWRRLKENGVRIFERTLRRRDATTVPVEVTANYVVFDGQEMSFSFVQDISEKKERENKNLFLTKIYSALFHTNQALLECKDERELFERICKVAVDFGGMALAWIGQVEESSRRIEVRARHGEGQQYLDGLVISSRADVAEGRGPCGMAFRGRDPVIVQDFATDPRTAMWQARARPFGWRASAAFAITRGGKSHAVCTFYHYEKNAFTNEIVDLMAEMAQNIGYGLDRFDLEAGRRGAEEELRVAAKVFEAHQAMLVMNTDREIIKVNGAFTNVTEYQPHEVIGKNLGFLQSEVHDERFYQKIWATIEREGRWQGEVVGRRKDGRDYPKLLTVSSVKDKSGVASHYVASFTDLTEYKAAQEKIQNLAFYDQLTGLPNRHLLIERLGRVLAISVRNQCYGAVLYLDMDHFKVINDTQGHDSGDILLQEVARRIHATLRHGDTIARVGGDEFVVLLEERHADQQLTAAHAKVVGDKLLEVLGHPYLIRGKEYHSSASVGVALYTGVDEDIHGLLKRADLAMYEAKRSGRNALCFFDPVMQETLDRRALLEVDLRSAIEEGQFQLVLQKQVGPGGAVIGAEALLRWQHPERGAVSPADFVPLAEQTGIIVPIGRWVLGECCRQLKAWEGKAQTKHLTLSMNVSTREFRHEEFVEYVRNMLVAMDVDPGQLVMEITESTLFENMEDSIAKMNELRAMGVSFSLDDFGTGYSSLEYLKKLPISHLKVDRAFVKDLGQDKNDEAIVNTIIQMGKTLNIGVIAEGVETAVQLRLLEAYGCSSFQGYLFGEPMAIAEFERNLAMNNAAESVYA